MPAWPELPPLARDVTLDLATSRLHRLHDIPRTVRDPLGCPCLHHRGCDARCTRFSEFALHRTQLSPYALRVLLSDAPPRRSSAPAVVDARGSDFSWPRDRHALPGVLRPSGVLQWEVASVRGSQAAIVVVVSGLSVTLADRARSFVRLAARPGSTGCPAPSSRLPFPPARRVSSWRHPWDFSLQRSDLVPSRIASRRSLPFFSLAGHPAVPR